MSRSSAGSPSINDCAPVATMIVRARYVGSLASGSPTHTPNGGPAVSSTRDAYIHPATHCAGDTSNANAPAMGTRLRLKSGYSLAGFNPHARAVGEALKRYGAFIADNGSNWYLSGASDKRWTDEMIEPLRDIPGSAFEVVRSAAAVQTC